MYSMPKRPRGVEKGARGTADESPWTTATFNNYESAFNINNERVQKSNHSRELRLRALVAC